MLGLTFSEVVVSKLMKIIKMIRLLLFACCLIIPSVQAYESSEDVTGASESALFQRYSQSKIVAYNQLVTADYLLALGAPKTVNGVMVLEYSERLAGDLTRITYQAPDDYSSEDMFVHFSSQLNQLSHKVLFECHARKCGSSNEWANRIFNIRKLYGPERYQHYLAVQIDTQQGPLFVALYSIKRGNKRVYTQLDLLKPQQGSFRELSVNPDTVLAQFKQQGIFELANLEFDDQDKLTGNTTVLLDSVIAALQKSSRLKLYVVGHLRTDQGLELLQQRSLTRAQSVVDVLVQSGIDSQRLSAQGVGPLAPVNQGGGVDRIGLVVQ